MQTENPASHSVETYLAHAGNLRFKLWAIVGSNESKKDRIISYLNNKGYSLVNVGEQLTPLYEEVNSRKVESFEIGEKIKTWFNSLPENIILTNASLLYHEEFTKISPVGAFKYNSRSKSAVLFLEDEHLIHNRLYYGEHGKEEFYDREINDILITKIEDVEISEVNAFNDGEKTPVYEKPEKLPADAIGRLFNFTPIKDVIDIDSDLREAEMQKDLVSSYIISEGLEQQIADFFDNLQKPNHKAVKIIGNYGSGKSHLLAFLVTLITKPELRSLVKNTAILKALDKVDRKFFTVQFELQPVQMSLEEIFFRQLETQIKSTYDIEIPVWHEKIFNKKEHLAKVVESLKQKDPSRGLLVIIDEVSDFLQSKVSHEIKYDFQFLRVVAQVCQDQDMMLAISMQEDIYTSPKFKNIAADEERIGQRFQTVRIRQEAVRQVIAQRIVPKSAQQQADVREKLKPYTEKIEDVANRLDDYISLFPFTPSLLNLFNELPYFEKRGVIQFAQNQLKYDLAKPFPYFYTFDRIFDLLANNPNIRNLEGVYDAVRVVGIIEQKILTNLEQKLHEDAVKLVKSLAVYSLWSKGQNGATAKELAEQLLILPQNKAFEAQMQVSLIVRKIRDATDGFYIKVVKDDKTSNDYFKFDPAIDGKDPEERIQGKVTTIEGDDDKLETEIFHQITEILDLDPYKHQPNVFTDECAWQSVKSFRKGLVVFTRKNQTPVVTETFDYVVNFISPYAKAEPQHYAANQLNIHIHVGKEENVELLKRIVAIRELMAENVLTSVMQKKLQDDLNGHRDPAGAWLPGIKYRMAKWILNLSDADVNGSKIGVKSLLGKDYDNLAEIFSELKKKVFDNRFNEQFPEHPKYSDLLTSSNISNTLTKYADEVSKGDFTRITQSCRTFLSTLNLLNANGDPDWSDNKIAQRIVTIVHGKGGKVVDIEKELVAEFAKAPYGIEPEVVQFLLVFLTTLGKVALKAKGGDEIDIANVREKFRNISQFENIPYAVKKEDLSFDFAQRLLNALGLNGAQMLQEKTRNQAFADYKRRIKEILEEYKGVEAMLSKLKDRQQPWLNRDDAQRYFEETKILDWSSLDIANPAQFNKLESINDKLGDIKDALTRLDNLKEALAEFNTRYHEGLDYMKMALDILHANSQYLTDKSLQTKLETLFNDSKAIVADFKRYSDRGERQPLKGKIDVFKNAYVHDFYYPAHERTVGNQVDWHALEVFQQLPAYHRATQLARLTCNSGERLQNKDRQWSRLRNMRTRNMDVERLFSLPWNAENSFMKVLQDYSDIQTESETLEDQLADICADYEATTIREIQANAGKISLIEASPSAKKELQKIADSGELPDKLSPELLDAINKLFHDIIIISLKRSDVIENLFGTGELLTMKQVHEAFINFEQQLNSKYKGKDFRIRIEE